jgi:hypothetical protein
MLRKASVFFLLVVCSQAVWSQRVQWRSFSFTEENEFFNIFQHGIDRFYTQGLKFEFTYEVGRRGVLEKLLIPVPGAASNIYSASIFQKIYTPGRTDLVDYAGDHPYGGALFLSLALDSYDSVKQFRLSTRLDAGAIGPVSLGEKTQEFFHVIINNDPAVAWNTQLRNDIFLNYFVKAEKAITNFQSKARVELKGEVNVGTALVSLVPGVNFEYGTWYNIDKKFSWQIFFRPEVRFVAFNAMLQGGILNQAYADELYSQYFLKEIKHVVYSHSTGLRLRYRRFEMLYRQVNLTREFTGQKAHYYSSLFFLFPIGKK